MKDARRLIKKSLKIIVLVISVVILCCGAVVGCIGYANWSAERRARAFCDEIAIGSDISTAIERAKDKKLLWGPAGGYTFYFPGFMFDKAVCQASVNREGKVISKGAVMEYD
jgi:hypothetical protein